MNFPSSLPQPDLKEEHSPLRWANSSSLRTMEHPEASLQFGLYGGKGGAGGRFAGAVGAGPGRVAEVALPLANLTPSKMPTITTMATITIHRTPFLPFIPFPPFCLSHLPHVAQGTGGLYALPPYPLHVPIEEEAVHPVVVAGVGRPAPFTAGAHGSSRTTGADDVSYLGRVAVSAVRYSDSDHTGKL